MFNVYGYSKKKKDKIFPVFGFIIDGDVSCVVFF